jgi:hypothetical protein
VRPKVRLEAIIGQGGRHESTDSTLQDLSEASNGSSGEAWVLLCKPCFESDDAND